ncbi:MAG: phosphoribosylamine--glycine ligase [Betaproteobacteria bacterium]|nr:phosphoribosylamine--glycine ligase [Betaproteobacteria bacterium]NBY05870.1 phosphoribosylamine--glycine ligase [Betaproteobacteria bacterium]
MKALVLGGGGREHALAWRLAQSPLVQMVYVAPGNGGTALDKRLQNIALTDVVALREWAQEARIDLTVVGPEALLAAGVVDEFRKHGLRIFGPTQAAAQLESSKAFSKDFMRRHGIPTARHETFTDPELAHQCVNQWGAPIVIKADGLAAGKGVVVASTLEQAHQAIDDMLGSNRLGVKLNQVGACVVIEEFLAGEEASFMVMCDGVSVLPLATSQDHKRLLDHDQGPNTGGMGAYSPAPVVTPEVHARVMREIIQPTLDGMKKDGIVYTGFLYAGLMIDANGQPKTLEFNCRLGDPETQPILMRLKSDFFSLLWSATAGELDRLGVDDVLWDHRAALGVVMASRGYPLSPEWGHTISGLIREASDAMVFHAGTAWDGYQLRTQGGRVLCVTALGRNVQLAKERAYQVLKQIAFEGQQFRTDIGHLAIRSTRKGNESARP